MNYSKTITRQQKAVKNIEIAASTYIHTLLLACYKSHLNSPEFLKNYQALENTDAIIEVVYNDSTTKVFDTSAPKDTLKDIKSVVTHSF